MVDLETGGLDPAQHSLLELSVVLLGWENDQIYPASEHSWNIEPAFNTTVTKESMDVNRIDPSDPSRITVSEKVALQECFRIIRRAIKDAHCGRGVLVGHNAHFDHGFLIEATKRSRVGRNPFHPFTVLDTASLSAIALGHTVLPEAARRIGIDYDTKLAHSSQYDAAITARVFCEIVNRSGYSLDS